MDKTAAVAAAVLEVKLDQKEVPGKTPVVGKKGKRAVGIMKQKFWVGKKATATKKPAAEKKSTEKKPTTEEKTLVA
ncbi:60S ribosomal protein L4 [Myotis davidii]|uniref:60S ribosomal protein L4 n=1 Tax=Myotis davidii TaxID=225400 RepID=L5LCW1_MYODS|nr:60S ribosomal protein L4 [Myotis davidii]